MPKKTALTDPDNIMVVWDEPADPPAQPEPKKTTTRRKRIVR